MKRSRKNILARLNYEQIPLTDYALALTVLGLTLFGILMIYDTSVVVAFERFGDRLWFLKNQSLWAMVGIGAGFIVSGVDYHYWQKTAPILHLASLILLVLVLVPGLSSEVYGARQRLVIPGGLPFLENIFIQPSELSKFTLILYAAGFRLKRPHLQFLAVVLVTTILIAIEPDLGNAILVASSALIVYFAAGVPLIWFGIISLIGLLTAVGYALSSDYRRQRLLTFFNPNEDLQGSAYQITQILIALGSGGLWGLGLGNSRQKYQYIPEVTTDSIFAVIGEELGLLGALSILVALGFVIWRGFKIAQETKDDFGRLLAIGLTSNIALQTIVNLGGMVKLLPLTGVPLPFISYGGSSLTLLLVSIGILINISRTHK